MTANPGRVRRRYAIDGVAIEVASGDLGVADALDRRLRGFRARATGEPQLRWQYLVARGREPYELVAPAGEGRPIYRAPGGEEIHYFPDADVLHGDCEGVRVSCEAQAGLARIESRGFVGRSLYLASHPLATISLIESMKRRGRFAIHAACLAQGTRGVLLAGPTGAGKSTLALALARAGLSFLADDMGFLCPGRHGVDVLGFSDAIGVTEDTVARFPGLASCGVAPDGFPKRLVRIEEAFAVQPAPGCVPAALLLLQVVRDAPSRLLPIDPKDAWLRLIPDVLLTEPNATQAHLDTLARLLSQVSCHRLEVGADLERAVELVASVL